MPGSLQPAERTGTDDEGGLIAWTAVAFWQGRALFVEGYCSTSAAWLSTDPCLHQPPPGHALPQPTLPALTSRKAFCGAWPPLRIRSRAHGTTTARANRSGIAFPTPLAK